MTNHIEYNVSSTSIEGKALAVGGDTCASGSVYAYVKEFDDGATVMEVTDIAAAPGVVELAIGNTTTLSVVGLKGELYSPIKIPNSDCTFVSDAPDKATVSDAGVITGVAAGTAKITVTYGDKTDNVDVTVA